jgi:hypothetical protein
MIDLDEQAEMIDEEVSRGSLFTSPDALNTLSDHIDSYRGHLQVITKASSHCAPYPPRFVSHFSVPVKHES